MDDDWVDLAFNGQTVSLLATCIHGVADVGDDPNQAVVFTSGGIIQVEVGRTIVLQRIAAAKMRKMRSVN